MGKPIKRRGRKGYHKDSKLFDRKEIAFMRLREMFYELMEHRHKQNQPRSLGS